MSESNEAVNNIVEVIEVQKSLIIDLVTMLDIQTQYHELEIKLLSNIKPLETDGDDATFQNLRNDINALTDNIKDVLELQEIRDSRTELIKKIKNNFANLDEVSQLFKSKKQGVV